MLRSIGALMVSRFLPFLGWYRSITLDQPASDLTDFPVLISGTYTYLKTVANGGEVRNSSGYDIAFYSDSALTTLLKFERVFWDATTGVVEFWVKIPTLASATATVIYIAYGNTTITTDQQDAVNTWDSNYKAVYHLPDGATLNVNDSTGVNNGTNNNGTATSGKIDGGIALSGSSQYVNIGNDSSIGITGDLTIEMWINPTDFGSFRGLLGKNNVNIAKPYEYRLETGTGRPIILMGDGVSYSSSLSTTAPTTGSWNHIAVTRTGVDTVHYLNGSTNGTGNGMSASISNGTNNAYIGTRDDFGTIFKGSMDEVRISNSVRSGDWISAEYSNQNDPANFYTIGSQTQA